MFPNLEIIIKALDQASPILHKIGGVMKQTEQIAGSVGNQMGKAFEATGNILKTGLVTGIIGATTLMGTLGVAGLNAANQFEKGQLKYETLLGSQQKALERISQLQDFAAKTPFELNQITQADVILQGFGIRSEKLLRTIGDAASISETGFSDLSLVLGQLSQSKDLQNIRQLVNRGIVSFNELSDAGIKFAKDGSVVNSVAETYSKVVSIMEKKFGGGMDKLSSTMEGRLSTLKDSFNLKLGEIATNTGFQDFVKNAISEVNRLVETVDIAGLITQVTNFGLQVQTTLQPTFDFLNNNQTMVQAGLVGLASVVGTLVVGALASLAISALTVAGPFIVLGSAVAIAYYAFQTGNPIAVGITTTLGLLAGMILISLIPSLYATAVAGWIAMSPFLPFIALAVLVGLAVFALKTAFDTNFMSIRDVSNSAIEKVRSGFDWMIKTFNFVKDVTLIALKFAWDNNFMGIRTTIETFVNVLGITFGILYSLLNGDTQSAMDGLKLLFDMGVETFLNTFNGFYETMKKGFQGAFEFVKGMASGFINSIGQGLVNTLSYIRNKIQSFIDSLPSEIGAGEIKISIPKPQLPQVPPYVPIAFAGGGIVPGNSFSGDKVLARLNSGEMVLNQNQQINLFSQLKRPSGAGIVVHIAQLIVREEADIYKIAEELGRLINATV